MARTTDLAFLENWFDGRALHLAQVQAISTRSSAYKASKPERSGCGCPRCVNIARLSLECAQLARMQKFTARGFEILGFRVIDLEAQGYRVRVIEGGQGWQCPRPARDAGAVSQGVPRTVELEGVPVFLLEDATKGDEPVPEVWRALEIYAACIQEFKI